MANRHCGKLVIGHISDWYLPTMTQWLDSRKGNMFCNRKETNNFCDYWSSTIPKSYPHAALFYDYGGKFNQKINSKNKKYKLLVRCVRNGDVVDK